jgi:hypothetical protein
MASIVARRLGSGAARLGVPNAGFLQRKLRGNAVVLVSRGGRLLERYLAAVDLEAINAAGGSFATAPAPSPTNSTLMSHDQHPILPKPSEGIPNHCDKPSYLVPPSSDPLVSLDHCCDGKSAEQGVAINPPWHCPPAGSVQAALIDPFIVVERTGRAQDSELCKVKAAGTPAERKASNTAGVSCGKKLCT